MYFYRRAVGPVDLAFTDRVGGVSRAPWESLNLSISGDDDEAAKAENHRIVLGDFAPGTELADLYQVHSARVVEAAPGDRPEADGIVTTRPDLTLLVRAADCVPVLLADVETGVIGAAHAGRRGMVGGVVGETVAAMRDLGAHQIQAWVGPSICGQCYEVPAEMRADVAAVEPAAESTTSWGTPSVDVAAGVHAQLARAGVETHLDSTGCTFERPDLFSYRRDGVAAGRLAALIRLRAESA